MPTYNASEPKKVMPKRNNPTRPVPSDEQVNTWWETFSKGVARDKTLGVSVKDGKNLYFYNNDRKLVRAVNEGENVADMAVRRRLMEQSLDGRLFTRQYSSYIPMQVITKEEEPYNVGVYRGRDPKILPMPDLIERPKAPDYLILKYLLYPFFKEEIQAYNQKKAAYDQRKQDMNWAGSFKDCTDPMDSPVRQDNEADERDPDFKTRLKEMRTANYNVDWEKEHPTQIRQHKNLATVSVEEFEAYLTEVSQRDPEKYISTAIKKPGATVFDYCDAVVQGMEKPVAAGLLAQTKDMTPEAKQQFLAGQQKTYQGLTAGLREFVGPKIGLRDVELYMADPAAYYNARVRLQEGRQALFATGLNEYMKTLPKVENTAVQPAREQQLTMEQNQKEMQEPQIKAPSLGGPMG